jgi:hypothetical protein
VADKIDIVVGASDKASAILKSVTDETKLLSDALSQTDSSAHKLELSMHGVTTAAIALTAAYAALKIGSATADFISKSSVEFVELKKASRGLEPALKDLAKSIELGTNIDERNIFSLMNSARAGGFGADQIDDATKAAIGLAEAMNVSLAEGMSRVKQAAEGNFAAFEALIPNINQLASVDEKLAAVSQLATDGLNTKKDAANSAVAVFDRMTVEMNNLYEVVGKVIEPFRQLAYQGIAVVAELLSQALEPAIKDFQDQFSGMTDSVDVSAKWLTEILVGAFTFVEVTMFNVGDVFNLAGSAILLSIEQMRSSLEHFFLTVIPEYASWFARNFLNILRDVAVGASHIVENLGTNLGEGFALIFEYIMGGWQTQDFSDFMGDLGNTLAQDLTRGFEPITEALPEIGDRAVSEWEKSLQGSMEESANNLVTEFDTKFKERMDKVNEDLKENPLNAEVNIKAKGDTSLAGMSGEVKMLQAVESRVMVRGSTEDPLLNLSKDQLNVLNGILEALREQPNNGVILEGVS